MTEPIKCPMCNGCGLIQSWYVEDCETCGGTVTVDEMEGDRGGIVHRSQIAWSDIKRTAGTGRLIALVRSLFHVLVRGHYGELCEVCGRPYDDWRAPTWLFVKLTGSQRGSYCPRCFTKFARDKGFATLMWTPQWWDGELAGRLLDEVKEME